VPDLGVELGERLAVVLRGGRPGTARTATRLLKVIPQIALKFIDGMRSALVASLTGPNGLRLSNG